MPQRSRPDITCGMAWAWIGVGVSYPSAASAFWRGAERPKSENWVKWISLKTSAIEPHALGRGPSPRLEHWARRDDPRDKGCLGKAIEERGRPAVPRSFHAPRSSSSDRALSP